MVSTVGSLPAGHLVSDGPPNGLQFALLRATVTSHFHLTGTVAHPEVSSQRQSSVSFLSTFFTYSFTYTVCSVADAFTKQMRKVTISSMSVCP